MSNVQKGPGRRGSRRTLRAPYLLRAAAEILARARDRVNGADDNPAGARAFPLSYTAKAGAVWACPSPAQGSRGTMGGQEILKFRPQQRIASFAAHGFRAVILAQQRHSIRQRGAIPLREKPTRPQRARPELPVARAAQAIPNPFPSKRGKSRVVAWRRRAWPLDW